jgi:hypothetical protein
MEDYDLIQVLWVEDDPEVTETYPVKAESFGLELVPFPCWDEAKVALEKEYDRWAAIILDAKCKQHRESADNAVRFLGEALKDIATISKERRRVIPWYILTGGAESEVSDSITDDRMKWDADWTEISHKKYYSKNVDNETLFKRIKKHAKKSNRIQIREIYQDTFKQLSTLKNKEVFEDISMILEAMHFPNAYSNFTPRLFYNPMRKALECVFRLAGNIGIIPEDFFAGGIVNLNQCFMFIIGRDAEKVGYRYGTTGEKIAPRHIHDMMSLIINLGNSNSHSTESSHPTELTEEEIQNYDNHIKSIGGDSKLLIFSIALQLCEIVKWMNQYITMNSDKERNKGKYIKLDDLIGIIELHNGLYHIGSKISVLIKQKEWIGKKAQILKFSHNTNSKTKDTYPFFAHYNDIRIIEEHENGSK